MLPTIPQMRALIRIVIGNKREQGHVVAGLDERLSAIPDSYDRLIEFARTLANLPLRDDWQYVEPSTLPEIWAECDPSRPMDAMRPMDLADAAKRVEAGFLGSVCGCILGKPVEFNPTLETLRRGLEAIGEWPLKDYWSEKVRDHLPKLHGSWPRTTRENIRFVDPDDDMNYTILGMLLLEQHGLDLNTAHVKHAFLAHLPVLTTWGPERTMMARGAVDVLDGAGGGGDAADWGNVLNPREEWCGAMIRADAYGYACPGRPALAAELAYRDSSFTHRRTGIYGTMFAAAAIAAAQVARSPMEIFETALKFVPRRSRYYKIISDSMNDVAEAKDWLDGYYRIHRKYKEYTHCLVFQETGTLINTLRFAKDVGDGICIQVMQGNDTDSYGATAGSILGCYFGPGHLEDRWIKPFNDDIHTALAWFFERSLSKLAKRMGKLPELISGPLEKLAKQ